MCPDGHFVAAINDAELIECADGGASTCPCWDESDVEGVGIDFQAEELANVVCLDDLPRGMQLSGSRGPDLGNDPGDPNAWIVSAAFKTLTASNQCHLLDNTHGIDNGMAEITDAQVVVCLQILLASAMAQLNDCPTENEPPLIGVDPASITDTLTTGGQSAHALTITNSGERTLYWEAWLTPPDSFAGIEVDSGFVEPQESFELGVSLDATGFSPGVYLASIFIDSNAVPASVVEVPLTLTVVDGPHIEVTPTTLDFGNVTVGNVANRVISISNLGNQSLSGSITSDRPEYTVADPEFVIGPGAQSYRTVTFEPTSSGSFPATLTIASNDPMTPVVMVPMTGTGVGPPVIDVSPSSLHAALPPWGQTTQTLFVANSGPSQLTFTVDDTGEFVDVLPSEGYVNQGMFLELAAGFDAAGLPSGIHEAEIRISSNDPLTPLVIVPVTLEVLAVPRISVSVSALDFGDVVVGQDTSLDFEITNVGDALLTVDPITSDTAEFTVSPDAAAIASGAAQSVTVTFSPSALSTFAGTLSIISDDALEPVVTIDLIGQGVTPAAIAVSPTFLSSTLPSGEEETQNMTISNSGGGVLEFSIEAVWISEPVTPTGIFVTPSPAEGSVGSAGTLDVGVHFSAAGVPQGVYQAALRINSNDPVRPLVTVPTTMTVSPP